MMSDVSWRVPWLPLTGRIRWQILGCGAACGSACCS